MQPCADALAVLGPLVLTADLLLLLGREVVGNVERLADLLGRLALDHVGDGLAADIEKGLDVKVVRGLVRGESLLAPAEGRQAGGGVNNVRE